MQPLQRNTSWTAHLREARLSGSTPGLHRTPSAPAEVQDEYDPELPDLDPEEYDPEEPALALSGVHKEEYDPEEPALERVSSLGDEEYDPAKPATAAQEEYDPESNVDATVLGSPKYSYDKPAAADPISGTPPGARSLSPRSPEESDGEAEESDGEHERGRGRETERDRKYVAPQQPPTRYPGNSAVQHATGVVNGFNGGNRSTGVVNDAGGSRFGIDAVVRSTAAALDALVSTARLSEESWYLWGEAGEARLSMAKQFAHGLLANDLLALLRDTNVVTEMRWRLTMERDVHDRTGTQQPAETPRVVPNQRQQRPPGIVAGTGVRPSGPVASLRQTPRQTPGPGYVCDICGVPGHWIADCPRKASTFGGNASSDGNAGASRRQTPRPPPDGYVCNACKIPGHWIHQCPKRTARFAEQAEAKRPDLEAAPYEDWMSPALSVLQEDRGASSPEAQSGADAKRKDGLQGGKRKRAGVSKAVSRQKRAATMGPPPPRTSAAGNDKEVLLTKMKSLMQQAEVAKSAAEKKRLLLQIKALQGTGTKKKTTEQPVVNEVDTAEKKDAQSQEREDETTETGPDV